jgi:hypothetical protein
MPGLAIAKRRTGNVLATALSSPTRPRPAFCPYTSAAAVLGLGLNSRLGWWWADPAAALVIAALEAREGIEACEHDD